MQILKVLFYVLLITSSVCRRSSSGSKSSSKSSSKQSSSSTSKQSSSSTSKSYGSNSDSSSVGTTIIQLVIISPVARTTYAQKPHTRWPKKNYEGTVCRYDTSCKPNPEVLSAILPATNFLLQDEIQCMIHGVDSLSCLAQKNCTVVKAAGENLDPQLAGYDLCIRKRTGNIDIAMDKVIDVYEDLKDDRCFMNENVWFKTTQCALQRRNCTEGCVEIGNEFPPHCRVDGAQVEDPLRDLELSINNTNQFEVPLADAFDSCFTQLRLYDNLLYCSYEQLYSALNTGQHQDLYEQCQIRSLYDPSQFGYTELYLEAQKCVLKSTREQCLELKIRFQQDQDDGAEAVRSVFLPGILGAFALILLSFF